MGSDNIQASSDLATVQISEFTQIWTHSDTSYL